MTTLFNAFLPEVLPYVPDCPAIIAINAIRSAAIEFCERSLAWQEDLEAEDSLADTGEYVLTVPEETSLAMIMAAWYDRRLMIPKSTEELARLYRTTDWRTIVGMPFYYMRSSSSTMRMIPAPSSSETGVIGVRAALAPTRDASGIDTEIYEDYLEAIAMGARARLHAMPGQPFYDMALAMVCRRAFMAGIGEAKIRANKGLSRASVRVEFQTF